MAAVGAVVGTLAVTVFLLIFQFSPEVGAGFGQAGVLAGRPAAVGGPVAVG